MSVIEVVLEKAHYKLTPATFSIHHSGAKYQTYCV